MARRHIFLLSAFACCVALPACAWPDWWAADGPEPVLRDPNAEQPMRGAGFDKGEAAVALDGPPRAGNLRLFRVTNDVSRYELRWDAPAIADVWSEFRVFLSDADFDDPAAALEVAVVTGTARSAVLTLPPDSGQAWLRVLGQRGSGGDVELSDALLADTTTRLVFVGDLPDPIEFDAALYAARFDASSPPQPVLERISHGPADGPAPRVRDFAVAPDGLHVAWIGVQSHPIRPYSLYVAALDGSEPPRRLNGELNIEAAFDERGSFRWSPDSRRIAFGSRTGSLPQRVYVVPADGSAPPRAISGEIPLGFEARPTGGHVRYDLRWSPDGQQIAFFSISAPPGVPGLYVAAADGSLPPRRVSDNPLGTTVEDFDWSPNGRYLVYRHSGRLFVAEVRRPIPNRRVSDVNLFATFEGWAADSRSLLFRYWNGPQSVNLGLIGEQEVTITTVAIGELDGVAWARGRDRFAYAIRRDESGNPRPSSDVYVTRVADPTNSVRVGFARLPEDFRWSPDASIVYFAAARDQQCCEAIFGYVADPDVADSYSRVLAPKFVGLSPRAAGFSPTSEYFAYSTVVNEFPLHSPMLFVERFGEEPRAWSLIAYMGTEYGFGWGRPKLEWTAPGNP